MCLKHCDKMLDRLISYNGAQFPVTLMELDFLACAVAALDVSDIRKIEIAMAYIAQIKSHQLWNDNLCERFFLLQCIKATCQRDEYCGEDCKQLRKG